MTLDNIAKFRIFQRTTDYFHIGALVHARLH